MSRRPRRKSWQPRPPACGICGDTGWKPSPAGQGVIRCLHQVRRPAAPPPPSEPFQAGLDRMRQASGEREPGEDLGEEANRG